MTSSDSQPPVRNPSDKPVDVVLMHSHTYEVMVDKKYVDEKWLKALDEEIVELEPWDPFGALARLK